MCRGFDRFVIRRALACALLLQGLVDEAEGRTSMELFKCQQCGRKFDSQEQLRKHEQECLPARVK